MRAAIIVTCAASWYLVGLAVTVGMVTYPGFALVGPNEWPRFHGHHSRRIAWAVGLAWVAQAMGLIWWRLASHGVPRDLMVTAGPAAAAVVLTAVAAVPLHQQLATRTEAATLRRLRVVHGIRVALWVSAAFGATLALR